jgi:oligopeptide/dipeptide ABC transporter ATP-binding protein
LSLLEVTDAVVEFRSQGGTIRALDGVSLHVDEGETVAVVGESGCGKTTLARAVLGLQALAQGQIQLLGEPVHGVTKKNGERVGMVWQDPFASLDPRWKIGKSVLEPMKIAGRKGDARQVMAEVGLDANLGDRYPHQLSGGQRQRAAIGRALSLRPPLIICDEPTAALDLSIRAQILNLIRDLQVSAKLSFLYISHDLTTVRFLADKVAVMYLGQIVEEGPTEAIFEKPKHPYTKALLDSAPNLDRLMDLPAALKGEVPDPHEKRPGCTFADRCNFRQEACIVKNPGRTNEGSRSYRCLFPLPGSEVGAK